jgi:hypothetical protein
VVDLCLRRYPPHFDIETATVWVINNVLKNPIQYYATRSADAFQITNLTTTPWTPKTFKADVVAVCADHGKVWQLLNLFRDSIDWARQRNAAAWRFETETAYDLKAIMQRLGAADLTPRYQLTLR